MYFNSEIGDNNNLKSIIACFLSELKYWPWSKLDLNFWCRKDIGTFKNSLKSS